MRTDKEIIEQTNALADKFYRMQGNISRPAYSFWNATHPMESLCWRMACEAQLLLTETDVDDCDWSEVPHV